VHPGVLCSLGHVGVRACNPALPPSPVHNPSFPMQLSPGQGGKAGARAPTPLKALGRPPPPCSLARRAIAPQVGRRRYAPGLPLRPFRAPASNRLLRSVIRLASAAPTSVASAAHQPPARRPPAHVAIVRGAVRRFASPQKRHFFAIAQKCLFPASVARCRPPIQLCATRRMAL
jgi:hypothetical protein